MIISNMRNWAFAVLNGTAAAKLGSATMSSSSSVASSKFITHDEDLGLVATVDWTLPREQFHLLKADDQTKKVKLDGLLEVQPDLLDKIQDKLKSVKFNKIYICRHASGGLVFYENHVMLSAAERNDLKSGKTDDAKAVVEKIFGDAIVALSCVTQVIDNETNDDSQELVTLTFKFAKEPEDLVLRLSYWKYGEDSYGRLSDKSFDKNARALTQDLFGDVQGVDLKRFQKVANGSFGIAYTYNINKKPWIIKIAHKALSHKDQEMKKEFDNNSEVWQKLRQSDQRLPTFPLDRIQELFENKHEATQQTVITSKHNGQPLDKYAQAKFKGGIFKKITTTFRAEHTLNWAFQMLVVLVVFEDIGMAHRDINPGNILADSAGNLTLIDFGQVNKFPSHVKYTPAEAYTIPEQDVDKNRMDVFSLGLTLARVSGLFDMKPLDDLSGWVPGNKRLVAIFKFLESFVERTQTLEQDGVAKKLGTVLKQMLEMVPQERPSAKKLLHDHFLGNGVPSHLKYRAMLSEEDHNLPWFQSIFNGSL